MWGTLRPLPGNTMPIVIFQVYSQQLRWNHTLDMVPEKHKAVSTKMTNDVLPIVASIDRSLIQVSCYSAFAVV